MSLFGRFDSHTYIVEGRREGKGYIFFSLLEIVESAPDFRLYMFEFFCLLLIFTSGVVKVKINHKFCRICFVIGPSSSPVLVQFQKG